jgi:hypothetical protein
MALIRLGPIIGSISGVIGGVAFVNSVRSTYARKRRTPGSALRAPQLAAQAHLGILSNAWNALTNDQRAAWTTAAKNLAHVNRLGVQGHLNGREFFFKRNLRNLSFSILSIESAPPTMQQTGAPFQISLTNPTATEILINVLDPIYGAGLQQFLWITRTYSGAPRRNFRTWTKAAAYATPIPGNENIKPLYDSLLGAPALGERIAARVENRFDAQLDSGPTYGQVVMTAV